MFGVGIIELIIGALCLVVIVAIVAGVIVKIKKKPDDQ